MPRARPQIGPHLVWRYAGNDAWSPPLTIADLRDERAAREHARLICSTGQGVEKGRMVEWRFYRCPGVCVAAWDENGER